MKARRAAGFGSLLGTMKGRLLPHFNLIAAKVIYSLTEAKDMTLILFNRNCTVRNFLRAVVVWDEKGGLPTLCFVSFISY